MAKTNTQMTNQIKSNQTVWKWVDVDVEAREN